MPSSLKTVIITGGTVIGAEAFSGCIGLTSITIPDSVISIGDYALHGCSGLTSITIPDSVTNIGVGAFGDCTGLTSIAIPDSVTNIGAAAFSGYNELASIEFEDTNGWFVTDDYDSWINKDGGVAIDVTDIESNVTYFTSNYRSCYWYKVE